MDAAKKIGDRAAVLLIGGQSDEPNHDLEKIAENLSGNVMIRLYKSSAHGVELLDRFPDALPTIIQWLNIYNRKAS